MTRAKAKRLEVLVVHPYPVVRAGMRQMLTAPDVRVVGEAAAVEEALQLVRKTVPRLVLLGCYPTSPDACIELLAKIKTRSPSTSVILMTGSERTFDLSKAMQKGCSGYLNPRITQEELLKAVRSIAAGECIIDPQLLTRLFAEIGQRQFGGKVPQDQLTQAEHAVLHLITEGQTNRDIAGRLGYSVATIKDHVQRIIQKLGVSDRTQAAVKAVKTGLVT